MMVVMQNASHSILAPCRGAWGRSAGNHCSKARTPGVGQVTAAVPFATVMVVVQNASHTMLAPCRGRLEGGKAYEHEVAEGHSLLYSLMSARRKDTGQPLTHLDICAQSFTFVLAGRLHKLCSCTAACSCLCVQHLCTGRQASQIALLCIPAYVLSTSYEHICGC